MIRLKTAATLAMAAFALATLALPRAAIAQDAEAWNQLVAAAKREGKVVVVGPPDQEVRQTLPAAFRARYGITVEYLGGRTSEQAGRLRAERASGLYTADLVIGGVQSMSTIFHKEKMLAPLRPVLILPEVVDRSKWKKGDLWFADPEQQYVLRLSNQVQPSFYINTGSVKAEEFKSGQDLFNPKWQGKISAEDPSLLGSGVNIAARFFLTFGEEGVKKLYIDQKPAISRDSRQLTDWLLRGTYPIAFNADDDQVEKMRAEGFPVTAIYGLPGLPATISAGFGMLALFSEAPHPEAAKLFANWLASKEAWRCGRGRARNRRRATTSMKRASCRRPPSRSPA